MTPRVRTLTEILIDRANAARARGQKAADPELIRHGAAEYYAAGHYGKWLVRNGIIDEMELDMSLAEQAAEQKKYNEACRWMHQAIEEFAKNRAAHFDALDVAVAAYARR